MIANFMELRKTREGPVGIAERAGARCDRSGVPTVATPLFVRGEHRFIVQRVTGASIVFPAVRWNESGCSPIEIGCGDGATGDRHLRASGRPIPPGRSAPVPCGRSGRGQDPLRPAGILRRSIARGANFGPPRGWQYQLIEVTEGKAMSASDANNCKIKDSVYISAPSTVAAIPRAALVSVIRQTDESGFRR